MFFTLSLSLSLSDLHFLLLLLLLLLLLFAALQVLRRGLHAPRKRLRGDPERGEGERCTSEVVSAANQSDLEGRHGQARVPGREDRTKTNLRS